jgi:hypothetical protein
MNQVNIKGPVGSFFIVKNIIFNGESECFCLIKENQMCYTNHIRGFYEF